MNKTIILDGREVSFSANGATPMLYKMAFREDLLVELQKGEDGIFEALPKLAYIMAMQGEGKVKGLSFEDMIAWLSQFESLTIEMAGEDIIEVFYDQQKTSVDSKKKIIE